MKFKYGDKSNIDGEKVTLQVVKCKRKLCGAALSPPNMILVKLRRSGERPFWTKLDLDKFRRERSYPNAVTGRH